MMYDPKTPRRALMTALHSHGLELHYQQPGDSRRPYRISEPVGSGHSWVSGKLTRSEVVAWLNGYEAAREGGAR